MAQNQKNAVDRRIQDVLTPYFRDIIQYDPKPLLLKVRCPVLAISGGNDLQAPPKQNLAAIREALAAGGNFKATVIEIPGLNHMLQTCQKGTMAEYCSIEETIAPVVLETILKWFVDTVQETLFAFSSCSQESSSKTNTHTAFQYAHTFVQHSFLDPSTSKTLSCAFLHAID
jgi:fermentation-respiration switch protein FrsA (DUF1100 family)